MKGTILIPVIAYEGYYFNDRKMSPGYTKRGKKILYLLFKKTNMELWEFRGSNGKKIDSANLKILRNLRKKGLVDLTEYVDGNIYSLTDEGKKIAKPIVEEVDEYKRW